MPEYLKIDANYLDNAEKQAKERGLDRLTIVDADSHYLQTPWASVAKYVEEPWRRRIEKALPVQSHTFLPRDLGDRTMEGRMRSYEMYNKMALPADCPLPPEIYPIIESSKRMGINYTLNFPTDLLTLGLHPNPEHEVGLAMGYNRWIIDAILPHTNMIKCMLYLPFSDPDACMEIVRKYSDVPGIIGYLITSTRHNPVYANQYMPLYELIESKGMPLAFHTVSHWREQPFLQMNRFASAHALGFPLFNMIQATNLVMNGIPERFPNLKFIFIEAGMAWLPFIMLRLDHEYMNRSADTPLLRHKPSHYFKQFYYTTQPLEVPEDPNVLRMIIDMVGTSQILYASDYPHQDFDLPTLIYDLPCLNEEEKRDILGRNAMRLFGDRLTLGNVAGRDY